MGILQMLKKGKMGKNGLLLDWTLLFQKHMEKKKLQKQFRIGLCNENRLQYPHNFGQMIKFCKVAKLAVLRRL